MAVTLSSLIPKGAPESAYLQSGILSGPYYSASEVSYGLPKPNMLQSSQDSSTLTIKTDKDNPIMLIFALGTNVDGAWQSKTKVVEDDATLNLSSSSLIVVQLDDASDNSLPISYLSLSPIPNVTFSRTAPGSPSTNDLWFDYDANYMKQWDGSAWQNKNWIILGEAGVGSDGYIYSMRTDFPHKGVAAFEDSLYPNGENPWKHYDGVSFTTDGQYTAQRVNEWIGDQTIKDAVAANITAVRAVANSQTSMDTAKQDTYYMDAVASQSWGFAFTPQVSMENFESGSLSSKWSSGASALNVISSGAKGGTYCAEQSPDTWSKIDFSPGYYLVKAYQGINEPYGNRDTDSELDTYIRLWDSNGNSDTMWRESINTASYEAPQSRVNWNGAEIAFDDYYTWPELGQYFVFDYDPISGTVDVKGMKSDLSSTWFSKTGLSTNLTGPVTEVGFYYTSEGTVSNKDILDWISAGDRQESHSQLSFVPTQVYVHQPSSDNVAVDYQAKDDNGNTEQVSVGINSLSNVSTSKMQIKPTVDDQNGDDVGKVTVIWL